MSAVSKKTISLPASQADYIDAKVASGEYASASEVVREGLRSLQARDAVVEKWLRDEVVPAALQHQANPERAVDGKTGFAMLRKRIADRRKAVS